MSAAPPVADLDYEGGISALDVNYVRAGLATSHLIVERGRAAFVDVGTNSSVPTLLAALDHRGVPAAAVDYLILTHIHLDHAGGVGLLARALPSAEIVVHPRGVAHLADPSTLIAATQAVYGAAAHRELYGDILPVERTRLRPAEEGSSLSLAGRRLDFLHTPGHALHHVTIFDHGTRSVFTGDTFGISYREFDVAGRPFLFPTTTPSQFDPAQLQASIRRIVALEPAAAFLTHYGRVAPVAPLAVELNRRLQELVELARECATGPEPQATLESRMLAWLSRELDRHGDRSSATKRRALLELDVRLNAQGLLIWLMRAARG